VREAKNAADAFNLVGLSAPEEQKPYDHRKNRGGAGIYACG
jgi:hypothetical protein